MSMYEKTECMAFFRAGAGQAMAKEHPQFHRFFHTLLAHALVGISRCCVARLRRNNNNTNKRNNKKNKKKNNNNHNNHKHPQHLRLTGEDLNHRGQGRISFRWSSGCSSWPAKPGASRQQEVHPG